MCRFEILIEVERKAFLSKKQCIFAKTIEIASLSKIYYKCNPYIYNS